MLYNIYKTVEDTMIISKKIYIIHNIFLYFSISKYIFILLPMQQQHYILSELKKEMQCTIPPNDLERG